MAGHYASARRAAVNVAARKGRIGRRHTVQTKTPDAFAPVRRFCLYDCRQRPTLPYSFPYSTIGGIRLNFRVRNGNGCDPDPMTTGILGAWGPDRAIAAHKPRLMRVPIVPSNLKE